jgi:Ni,Fe-hydrogenase III large subunit
MTKIETITSAKDLEAIARRARAEGARLADLFGTARGDEIVLRLVYARDRDSTYEVHAATVEGDEYPLTPEMVPAGFVEQSEMFEQFGVRPVGGKPLERTVMPPNAESRFPLSGGRRTIEPRATRAPHVVQGDAFEFPFGPVRVAGWESLYFGLVTTGEEVLDLYLFYWHKHRGIERRLRGQRPERALFLVERAEGLSAIGNGLAFCRAVEAVAGVAPPPQAAAARGVALELERVYNHAAAIAAMCQATGLSVGQAQAEIALEQLLRVNLAVFGHRYLFNVLCLGGVRRGPDFVALERELPPACAEIRRVIEALLATNSHVDRLEATGQLTHETAARLGLVGPVARAAACDIDTRRDHPWPPYDSVVPKIAVREGGDILARMQVLAAEIDESERLVKVLAGEAAPSAVPVDVPSGAALGWAESPRGESLVWVALDDEGHLERVRLRPGSARNWRAFDDAVRAQNVFTDVPIIEASFWLTVAGVAR